MLHIDTISLPSRFILAPLAGFSDLPFRLLCREFGAGLCVSEMISCHGLVYGQQKTLDMIATIPEEKPVSFQLFGADPEIMGKAAAILKDKGAELIDINMGCPVKKVTKKGAGAALMKEPSLAAELIRRVKDASGVPVTVKFRAGTDRRSISAVHFAKMAEESGASAVTVHGRTWAQGFSGTADWQIISDVKKNVSIPVIGNGDIITYRDGLSMMETTGCDGVMIGRGAMGNPWVFQKSGKPTQLFPIISTVFHHLDLIEQYSQPDRLLGGIKNHIGKYFKGLPGSSKIRKSLYDCSSFAELKNALGSIPKALS